jgi:hypothetical protein
MPEQQAVLPTLDLPPARYGADLPADRVLATLIGAGDRFGCWVLRHQSDPDWNDGCVFHFDTEQEATDLREDILGGIDPGQNVPPLVIEQQPAPCFTLVCAACGTELGDEDYDITLSHHPTLTSLATDARAQDWSTDGRDWTCPNCPALTGTAPAGQAPS